MLNLSNYGSGEGKELVQLADIADQSIYAYNVRGPLGLTAVNKGISESLQNKETHKKFPIFPNGITIIANKMTANNKNSLWLKIIFCL